MSHDGNRPLILVIDEDPTPLGLVASELELRYGGDHDIHCVTSVEEAEDVVRGHGPDDVAIVMVDQRVAARDGFAFLTRCNAAHPRSKRLILIRVGDRDAWDELTRSLTMGYADYFVTKPMRSGDHSFHRVIAEMLDEWATLGGHRPIAVTIVAPEFSPRAHRIRDLLQRNAVMFRSVPAESDEGASFLESAGVPGSELPVMILYNGVVLVDPSDTEAADAFGARTKPSSETYDVAIVGGGPAGLAAALYCASEGLQAVVLEREAIGGQAGTSSRIRNYLGFPYGVTGVDLARRAFEQAWLFGAEFCFMQEASMLRRVDDGYEVLTKTADRLLARSAILATGVSYRRLGIEALDRLVGMGVFYGAAASEAAAVMGRRVFVVGGGNSAGQAAIYLARYAAEVTILVRGPSLAESMSTYLISEIEIAPNVHVRFDSEVVGGGGDGHLQHVTIRDRVNDSVEPSECDALFVMIGAIPHTDWLPRSVARDDWGFIQTGRDLDLAAVGWREPREPYYLETSLPGVFAVGDIRHRSVKRVANAVGEGSVAIQMVHQYLEEQARRRGATGVSPSATRSASPA